MAMKVLILTYIDGREYIHTCTAMYGFRYIYLMRQSVFFFFLKETKRRNRTKSKR